MSERGPEYPVARSPAGAEVRDESARKRSVFGLIGLCCTAFCLVGMPLLGLALSGLGLEQLGHGWAAWAILGASLGVFGLGLVISNRHHRHPGPLLVSIAGAGFLLAKPSHLLPGWAEWVGMAVLIGVWFWDRRLHLRHHSNPRATATSANGGRSHTSSRR